MKNICVFDIETVPDIISIKKIDGLSDNATAKALTDEELFDYALLKRRSEVGHEFMRHHLQKIVAISVVVKTGDKIKCASLGEVDADEKTIIEKFFNIIDNYQPILISWNGSGFDLPILQYRALLHGVVASHYWDIGHFDNTTKWANYQSRFQMQHMDLMDIISGYQAKNSASLNDICKMLDFPGKLATDGSAVLDLYQAGDIEAIRDYCETDVLNTYLVYLRFELIRGLLTSSGYNEQLKQLVAYLQKQDKYHFNEFLEAWSGKPDMNL